MLIMPLFWNKTEFYYTNDSGTKFCLQIVTFNNKLLDVSLRVSSIDYLGVVAAHLRKDGVLSHQMQLSEISEMLDDVSY